MATSNFWGKTKNRFIFSFKNKNNNIFYDILENKLKSKKYSKHELEPLVFLDKLTIIIKVI